MVDETDVRRPPSSPAAKDAGPMPEVDFLKTAISQANLNALRLSVLQATGDPALAAVSVERKLFRGGSMWTYIVSKEDEDLVKAKCLSYILAGFSHGDPPGKGEARKLMDLFGEEPVSDADFQYNYEELAFEDVPRTANWSGPAPVEKLANYRVAVIGGGIGGIAAAIQLGRLGIPYRVIERQGDIGGTWLLNNYPNVRVDTPSHLFQFKFVKNYAWPQFFADGATTRDYLQHCADLYSIRQNFSFNQEVTEARWKEESSEWELTLVSRLDGSTETIRANSIISASGLFATANLPDIPGIHDCKVDMFHTTQWDHTKSYEGKRVALIGNGSTGVQLAPALAAKAKSLDCYQRTPEWMMKAEGYNDSVSPGMRFLFDTVPYYWNWYCYAVHVQSQQLQNMHPYDREWQKSGGFINRSNDAVRENLTEYIRASTVGRPDLMEKLLPPHAPLVRRLVVDNGFYRMLHEDHVQLLTDGIDRFTPKGIKSKDGIERQYDLIVLAAGFKVSSYFHPTKYVGRDGATFDQQWAKDGARSYLGLVNPGMPNFFSFYGPNHQPRAGSYFSFGEIWARFAAKAIVYMLEHDKTSMVVRQERYDTYNAQLDKAAKGLLWEAEGHGYYVNSFGRSGVNMPWTTADYHKMVFEPVPSDYEFK